MKQINLTDAEQSAFKVLADAAVRAGGLQYVPNAYLLLSKFEKAKEIEPAKGKKKVTTKPSSSS